MKILKLRFKNLNSLYGEWLIDFDHAEFTSNGIFAITGPTGSGKSTILDAICLALYGETPRLGKITKSGNEIMSRHTGECFAEVTFQSQAGKFCCHWSQSRAHKKPDGALQEARHEIMEINQIHSVETKKKEVARLIEEHTGMDFNRFTRSMMLAQGQFSRFLLASADERSPILEQITGTAIYSEISKKVHERYKEEKEKTLALQALIAHITPLSAEQSAALLQQINDSETTRATLTTTQRSLQQAIQWHQMLQQLQSKIAQLQQQQLDIQQRQQQFQPQQLLLQIALAAAEIEGKYVRFHTLQQHQERDQAHLEQLAQQLPERITAAAKQAQQLQTLRATHQAAKQQQQQQALLLQQVRELDSRLQDQQKQQQFTACEVQQVMEQVQQKQTGLQQIQHRQQALQQTGSELQQYLTDHAADVWLVAEYAGIATQIQQLQELRQDALHKRMQIQQLTEQEQTDAQEDLQQQQGLQRTKQKQEEAAAQLEIQQQALAAHLMGRSTQEYRTEHEHLLHTKGLVRKIVRLEEERKHLTAGEPCPLCGAVQHPFATEEIPQLDEIDQKIQHVSCLIKQAEQLNEQIQQLQRSLQQLELEWIKQESQRQAVQVRQQARQEIIQRLQSEQTVQQNRLRQAHQQMFQALAPLQMDDSIAYDALILQLKTRLERWQQVQQDQQQWQQQLQKLEQEQHHYRGLLQQLLQQQETKRAQHEQQQQVLHQLRQERQQLFGDQSPTEVEQQGAAYIEQCEQAEQAGLATWQQRQALLADCETRLQALQTQQMQRAEELAEAQAVFQQELQQKGFRDEADFMAHRWPLEERQQLQEQAQQLAAELAENATRLQDQQLRWQQERERELTDQPLESLEQQHQQLHNELDAITLQLGALRQQWQDAEQAQLKLQKHQGQVQRQELELVKWGKLQELIGSADGKKYRNFAQGLTFEVMVAHANQQLSSMSDRYLLVQDQEQPLALNVVDDYQAAEVRSTKNLSGGESFLVSLALALGLSKMSSRNVRVDSLFLDEGFGSLDDEALESALEALSSLQQENKLIGMISHVPALKERIHTQLQVIALAGGKSSLQGVGVQMVNTDR